ncbi:MAG: hypothetical protein COY40_03655 [Alphaproteobacteria bacterium CG_4_10_14_0_8_um_filter_53_9]|nr:MAG: hypothetical protein COY40_03655 [Alphaproteobacteria bacterium CG_4_10_14_0_8_um_filter_53_9]
MDLSFLPEALTLNLFILFSLILLAGLAAGGIAHRTPFVPSITAYMLVGMAIGPGGLGLLNYDMMASARIFIDIALALIMLDLGRHLVVSWIRKHPSLLKASALEVVLTLALVTGGLVATGMPAVPSLVVAAIVLAASPAILLLVVREFKVKGPVTDYATVLVGLNNFASVLVFAVAMVFMYGTGEASSWVTGVLHPLYLVAAGVGIAIVCLGVAEAVNLFGTEGRTARFSLLIAILMLAVGLSYMAGVPPMLTALFMGFISANLKHETPLSEEPLGKESTLFFIILFVLAGAKMQLMALATVLPLVLLVVVLRQVAKHAAILAFTRKEFDLKQQVALGFCMLPMAGMAVGLIQTTDTYFPAIGGMLTGVVLGAVMVLETLGPVVTELALKAAGELKSGKKVGH